MCGIVGVVGRQANDAIDVLLNGLKRLEYRGYDSAGIYYVDSMNQTDQVVKAVGPIKHLEAEVNQEQRAQTGIGHTRWATHGKASLTNSHPHVSQNERFVLVHNGVIENAAALKATYLQDVTFTSETDSEVIVQLVEHFASTQDVFEAFKHTLTLLEGSYAVLLMDREHTDEMYIAKHKSPLLLAVGEGFNGVCSDALAMIEYTDQFIALVDGDVATIRPTSYEISNLDGIERTPELFTANIDQEAAGKGTYPYFMLKEIDEQPIVMRRLVETYLNKENESAIDASIVEQMMEADRIYIIGCGTSYHAGLVGKKLIEEWTHIPVEVHIASEFAYYPPIISERPFFIFLSQSGETADSRQVLVQTNEMNYPSLTLTNVVGSTLAREATYALYLNAGVEVAVASTKAYTAQVGLLAILAQRVGDQRAIDATSQIDLAHELSMVSLAMEVVLEDKQQFETLAHDFLATTRKAFYIGRGVDYYSSIESALKLKEISYIQTEGFAAGELKHGTISLIEEETPVIGLITEAHTAGQTRSNLSEVASRGAHVLIISNETNAEPTDQYVIKNVHPTLQSLVTILPTQLLAYYATIERGYDVDKPRNLAKSVTVE